MIKLIATDLDGTLFYPRKKIKLLTKENQKFLHDFISDGNNVVLVSGRNFEVAKRIENKIKQKVAMIACNGSIIYANGKIIDENPMNMDDVKKLYYDNIKNKNVSSWIFMTNQENMIIVPNHMNYLMRFFYRIGMILQFKYRGSYKFGKHHLIKAFNNPNTLMYKAMPIFGLGEKGCQKALNNLASFKDNYGHLFEMFNSHESIEFVNKGLDKAKSLEKFASMMNIKKDEVVVLGDSGNDVPLFETFEHSFVMSSASPLVKQHAKNEVKYVYEIKDYIEKEKVSS